MMNIVWTFDPFQENKELVISGKKIIKNYFSKDSIEALYVASRAENELNYAFDIDKSIRYSEYPKSLIEKELKKMSMSQVNAKVLSADTISQSSIVKEMVQYSDKMNKDLVVIASNAKKLLPRLVLGSFAESLIHQSKTDLLVFNQKSVISDKQPKHIVYGHDFSVKSNKGLDRVVEYAKKWNSKLTIVHVDMQVSESAKDKEKSKLALDKKIAEVSSRLGEKKINFNFLVLENKKLVEELVLNTVKKLNADLVAVTAQSNNLSVLLGGSTTRYILRSAKVPVLVIKTK